MKKGLTVAPGLFYVVLTGDNTLQIAAADVMIAEAATVEALERGLD